MQLIRTSQTSKWTKRPNETETNIWYRAILHSFQHPAEWARRGLLYGHQVWHGRSMGIRMESLSQRKCVQRKGVVARSVGMQSRNLDFGTLPRTDRHRKFRHSKARFNSGLCIRIEYREWHPCYVHIHSQQLGSIEKLVSLHCDRRSKSNRIHPPPDSMIKCKYFTYSLGPPPMNMYVILTYVFKNANTLYDMNTVSRALNAHCTFHNAWMNKQTNEWMNHLLIFFRSLWNS